MNWDILLDVLEFNITEGLVIRVHIIKRDSLYLFNNIKSEKLSYFPLESIYLVRKPPPFLILTK